MLKALDALLELADLGIFELNHMVLIFSLLGQLIYLLVLFFLDVA